MAVLIFLAILALVFLFPSNRREVLIAFDQLLNARLGGYADETFSARCWRERTTKRKYAVLTMIINGIFFWQQNHCRGSYESELNRHHLPEQYRHGADS